jgi:RNA 2',3'-cyclic 3'-phosphodiesterase
MTPPLMTVRAFVALEIPSTLQQAIIKQAARLYQSLGADLVRWVPVENIHLTLKFLGDVPSNHLDFLKQSLTQIATSSPAFDLQLDGLGAFPNRKQPRVLWIGIQAGSELHSIKQNIESAMNRLGYEKEERSFSPHLTLGRVRPSISPADTVKIRDALQAIQLGRIGTARVNSVHLFKSDLSPAGSQHTKLFSVNFKS